MTAKTDTNYFKKQFRRYYLQDGISLDTVEELLEAPGEILSDEPERVLRRVDHYMIETFSATMRATRADREKGFRIWTAGTALKDYEIPVIMPVAYVEKRLLGRITGYSMIFAVPEGLKDAKSFLAVLLKWTTDKQTVERYLAQLARAVQRLWHTEYFHAELWGHNILTQNGQTFYFTGLEAMEKVEIYSEDMSLDNLIQLYDSFRELLNDHMLVPFMTQLLGEEHDPRIWMPRVRDGYEDLLVERAEQEDA